MSEDDWEPTDDVDSLEDPTEDRLRWRIRAPDGSTSVHFTGFHNRTAAVLGAVIARIPANIVTRLHELNHEVAGWDAIEAYGWRLEPWSGRSLSILFKGPMVRGIIDRRKTKSRRLVTIRPEHTGGRKRQTPDPVFTRASVGDYSPMPEEHAPREFGVMFTAPNGADLLVKSPYGRPGDELKVRESYRFGRGYDGVRPREVPQFAKIHYEADGPAPEWAGKLRPSIFLPDWASRIRLQLESLTVERLLPISAEEVRAEGVPENWMEADPTFFQRPGIRDLAHHIWDNMRAEEQWIAVWDSINGKGTAEKRPWVWVLGFSILEAPDKVMR